MQPRLALCACAIGEAAWLNTKVAWRGKVVHLENGQIPQMVDPSMSFHSAVWPEDSYLTPSTLRFFFTQEANIK